ncbi:hypothetical protein QQ045_000362 [Rhodiola kirilowii]
MPYNFSPSMCMNKEFNILGMLISGPKSPGKCLNVFMRPLIDELKILWDTRVPTYDRHDGSSFIMKAAVLWTISDFPGLGMLGGLNTKGYKACPLCLDDVDTKYLAGRMSYQGHRSQPYSLDVMHIEKNVFDNIIGTILGLEGKTKDDVKAREGLEKQGVRKHLWKKIIGPSSRKDRVSQAPYTVLPEHKIEILEMMKDAKYPFGYVGSLQNKINLDDKKFNGLKTHDFHVMLQRLLPIFIWHYLPYNVVSPLVSLSQWFQKLCCRELNKVDFERIKEDIVMILCQLERIFPPAFFTIMVHLMIHLPDQVLLKDPVHFNWMYPMER